MVISLKNEKNSLETVFFQSGMIAMEMISLLELAKMNIYQTYMNGDKK